MLAYVVVVLAAEVALGVVVLVLEPCDVALGVAFASAPRDTAFGVVAAGVVTGEPPAVAFGVVAGGGGGSGPARSWWPPFWSGGLRR